MHTLDPPKTIAASKAVVRRFSSKKLFLKFSQIYQANNCNFIKKRLQHRCFPMKFKKISKNTFLQSTSGGCFWPSNIDKLFPKIQHN